MTEIPSMVDDFLAACAAADARLAADRQWRRDLDTTVRAILRIIEATGDELGWPWDPVVSRAMDGATILLEIAAAEPPEDPA